MSGDVTPAAPLRAVVEELVRGGVREVIICPGSRSTPLALALQAASALRTWVHLDERAGAFFALGAAMATRRPVAILATSGTAVVNFAPAVVEARYGRVPLVLLTADRPAELHGIGSPQTIDQVDLYGRHAKWFAELPLPEASETVETETRSTVVRALDVTLAAPAGPVQLNLPFREPLVPEGSLHTGMPEPGSDSGGPPTELHVPEDVEHVAGLVRAARRGLIVCGPMDTDGFAAAVAGLASATGFPIFADGLANVRTGRHDRSNVIARYDVLLRTEAMRRRPGPDLVIRFGATPTSKPLSRLLDGLASPQVLVDDGAGWQRPGGPELVATDPLRFADDLAAALGPAEPRGDWLSWWQRADGVAAEALAAWREARTGPFEGALFEALETAVPDGTVIVVGNSMPVRDLDAFLPSSPANVRILGNRGANGIDGVVSTALGAAATQDAPVLAVVGDISLLHDLNALLAARRLGLSATIVLVNNDGGGIFSFLPQALTERPEVGLPDQFETLFGTPHGTAFGPLVVALGAEYAEVPHRGLAEAVAGSVGRPGVRVIELRTDRTRNVDLHRAAQAAVAQALEGLA